MNKLQQMEDHALAHGYCMKKFNTHEWAEVIDEGTWFRYTFNGTYKLREDIKRLIPENSTPFEGMD